MGQLPSVGGAIMCFPQNRQSCLPPTQANGTEKTSEQTWKMAAKEILVSRRRQQVFCKREDEEGQASHIPGDTALGNRHATICQSQSPCQSVPERIWQLLPETEAGQESQNRLDMGRCVQPGHSTKVIFEMPEPCEGKLSRTVLRGKGAEKPPTYPIKYYFFPSFIYF